ncbi:hypothetical protein [Paenibacillus cremeus]|uniref:hypothetical protein n=1 Tax=Paenibacillus cremeus TaxID=2163881 RepID=UPI001644808D|nr:hypothetical protein [Paenibacillus cremeus]
MKGSSPIQLNKPTTKIQTNSLTTTFLELGSIEPEEGGEIIEQRNLIRKTKDSPSTRSK